MRSINLPRETMEGDAEDLICIKTHSFRQGNDASAHNNERTA